MRDEVLRRSRIESDIRADIVSSTLAKSRLESEAQAFRLNSERAALNDSIRRSRVQYQV